MRTTYETMEALKSYTDEHLEEYFDTLPSAIDILGGFSSAIESPDTDNMKTRDMIYFEFDNGEVETQTIMSDMSTMAMNVFFICSREDQATLQKKCFGYFEAFYNMIRSDNNIGGAVDMAYISDWEWHPYANAKPGCAAIECVLILQWQKIFAI